MTDLSLGQARRIALAAQGLTTPPPDGTPDVRHVRKMFGQVGVVQLDSVNVCARAHDLLMYARLGAHQPDLLHRFAYQRREAVETWAHEASLVPMADWPLWRWRQRQSEQGITWKRLARHARDHAADIEAVAAEVEASGPVAARHFEDGRGKKGPWWDWSGAKLALEWLFRIGRVAALRQGNFERVYESVERVVPADLLAVELTTPDAHRKLVERAVRGLGVATDADVADYWRLKQADVKPRLAELAEAGVVTEARVEGWDRRAWLHADAVRPRRRSVSTLVSPFDPIVWFRPRAERLFDFEYRIEIYTPAEKRRFGYYVLPFLHDDRLCGRTDLKADRQGRRLLVQSAWHEPWAAPPDVAEPLAVELRRLADWLGLEEVVVADRGDLAPFVRRALA